MNFFLNLKFALNFKKLVKVKHHKSTYFQVLELKLKVLKLFLLSIKTTFLFLSRLFILLFYNDDDDDAFSFSGIQFAIFNNVFTKNSFANSKLMFSIHCKYLNSKIFIQFLKLTIHRFTTIKFSKLHRMECFWCHLECF